MTQARAIISAVSSCFAISEADLLGKSRIKPVSEARNALYWLLRVMPPAHGGVRSFPQVAALTGRGDHGTVMSGCNRAEALMERCPDYVGRIAWAGELLAGLAEPVRIAVPPPPPPRKPAAIVQHCRPRNRMAQDDPDALNRMRGTYKLGQALALAMKEREAAK